MNIKFMALSLCLLLVIACTKSEDSKLVNNDASNLISTSNLKTYDYVDELVLNVGASDLDAMFVYSIGFTMEIIQSELTMKKVSELENRFKSMTYDGLLQEIAAFDKVTAEQLALLFPILERYDDAGDRLELLESKLQQTEETAPITSYRVFLEGYVRLIKKQLNENNGGSRDCIDDCFNAHQYGWEWLHFYSIYCADPVNDCNLFVQDPLAVNYANNQLLLYCHKLCNPKDSPA